jgi:DNA-binding winged helix-turn-helix (wHTH) protein/Tol biopolymer transport system component
MKLRPPVVQFGPFEFNPTQHELRNGGDRATLPSSLNKLLLLFVSRAGELVTREEIADALWEDQSTVDIVAGINTAVRRLRTELGDGNGIFIETVVGAGYRFAAPVSVAEVEEPSDRSEGLAANAFPWKRRLWTAAICVLVLFGAAGGWMLYSSRQTARTAEKPFLLHSHPVTFDEVEDQLTAQAISPSGSYVAYSDRTGITLHPLAAGDDRHLDPPASLQIDHIAWALDERALLVSGTLAAAGQKTAPDQGRQQTWRIALGGQPAQLLLDDAGFAAVSPTDGRIAVLRAHQTEVWVYGPNGESAHQLVKTPYGDTFTCLLWSPRGDRIVVDRYRPGLPVLAGADLNAKNGNAHNPLGGSIYESYSANSGSLLASHDNLRFDSAVLLPDGRLLYPVSAPPDEAKLAVVKTDPATGAFLAEERLIPSHVVWGYIAYRMAQLSSSADGKTLSSVLDQAATEVDIADIGMASAESRPVLEDITRLTRHTGGAAYPTAWSPDGSEVVFDDGIGGPIAIAAQRVDGSRMQILAASNSDHSKFAQGQFSPDGRWLLFLNLDLESSHVDSIERVPAHGGVPEVVKTTGAIEEFHCSAPPAGRCVLREVEGKKSLVYYALDPVLGIGKELARTPWEPNLLGDWTLSPDGSTVAMANHDPTHPCIQLVPLAPTSSRRGEAAVVKEIPVTGFGTTLASHWASDDKGFFVETYTGKQYDLVWVTPDGHPSLLAQSPDLIWAVPSPDGKKIAFPSHTPLNRNVWVGTNPPAVAAQ